MKPAGDIRINAGKLRHPITINAWTPSSPPTYNEAGQVSTWQPFVVGLMAAVSPDRASLNVRNGLQVTETITPITIRYFQGVTANMQVVLNDTGDVYQIQGINDIDRRRVVMELECIQFGNANSPAPA